MTTNAIEKLLWTIVTNPAEADGFREDPDACVRRYRIDAEEREIVTSLDVGSLAAREVNSLLLLMAFMAVKGRGAMPDYMASISRASAAKTNAKG